MRHIKALYMAPVDTVHEALRDPYPSVSRHHEFLQKVNEQYGNLLMGKLEHAVKLCQGVIEEKTRYFGVDLPTKLICLVGLTPLRQDYLKEEPDFFDELEEGEKTDTRDDDALAAAPEVFRRASQDGVPQRVHKQRSACISVKKALHRHRHRFAMIDFVEGGCQDLTSDEYRSIQESELNKDGEQYFFILKGLIVLDLQDKLNTHVYEPLENQLLTDMTKAMLEVVSNYKDEDIQRIVSADGGDMLKQCCEDKKSQIDQITRALVLLQGSSTGELPRPPVPSINQVPERTSPATGQIYPQVTGELRLPKMELRKLPTEFKRSFMDAAKKDIAKAFSHPLAKTRVVRLQEGLEVHYCLDVAGQQEFVRTQNRIQEAMSQQLSLSQAADVYAKALGRRGFLPALGMVQSAVGRKAAVVEPTDNYKAELDVTEAMEAKDSNASGLKKLLTRMSPL
jgi:hypothetical protein